MTHCSLKSILQYHQGACTQKKKAVIQKHMMECSRCAAVSRAVAAIVRPAGKMLVLKSPSAAVRSRVLSYYDQALERKRVYSLTERLRSPKVRLAAAAFISAILALSVFFALAPVEHNAKIRAMKVSGIVKSGKHVVTKGRSLVPGSHVETGRDSQVALASGDMMKLKAGEQTSLLIKSAHKEKDTGKTVFGVVVEKGTLSAQFDQSKNLEYTLQTPHATIMSKGSEIVVKVDTDRTRLLMKSGSAVVSSSSGNNITAEQGDAYTILPALSMNTTGDSDSQDDIVYDENMSLPDNGDFLE